MDIYTAEFSNADVARALDMPNFPDFRKSLERRGAASFPSNTHQNPARPTFGLVHVHQYAVIAALKKGGISSIAASAVWCFFWIYHKAFLPSWDSVGTHEASSGAMDMDEARRRKTAAETALVEMGVALRRGELIDIEEIAPKICEEYRGIKEMLYWAPELQDLSLEHPVFLLVRGNNIVVALGPNIDMSSVFKDQTALFLERLSQYGECPDVIACEQSNEEQLTVSVNLSKLFSTVNHRLAACLVRRRECLGGAFS